MKLIVSVTAAITMILVGLVASLPAHALGLKVAPLEYKTTLREGERKQGIIDISNPSAQPILVKSSVQAFKQINNQGGLRFYDDEQIAKAITVDAQEIELGPHEAARVSFVMDGMKLPTGDIYAALFFTTDPKKPTNGVGQLVRVGTLLSIVNKTPGQRLAKITALHVPFMQSSPEITGSYTIKNTGKSGGFYPMVSVSSWPGGVVDKARSTLLFAGHERSNEFTHEVGYGIHRIEVGFGEGKKTAWVIALAPWMVIFAAIASLVAGAEIIYRNHRRKLRKKTAIKPPSATSGN